MSGAYGLAYCLVFALAMWAYDAWVLTKSHGESPALKLSVGLPIVVCLGLATGRVLRRRPRPGSWVTTWLVTGALIGLVAGALPSLGRTLATWLLEPGLRGIAVHPAPAGLATRTLFFAALMAGVGTVTGLVGWRTIHGASQAATSSTRRGLRSWALLSVCLPLAALPALAGDELINEGLRASQRAASDGLESQLSGAYALHPIDGAYEEPVAIVDVVLGGGFAMRCNVPDGILTECLAVSSSYRGWTENLIEAAIEDTQASADTGYGGGLSVARNAIAGLVRGADSLSGSYEVARSGQYGDWVVMSARFDTGAHVRCFYHGHDPVVLNHCDVS